MGEEQATPRMTEDFAYGLACGAIFGFFLGLAVVGGIVAIMLIWGST